MSSAMPTGAVSARIRSALDASSGCSSRNSGPEKSKSAAWIVTPPTLRSPRLSGLDLFELGLDRGQIVGDVQLQITGTAFGGGRELRHELLDLPERLVGQPGG